MSPSRSRILGSATRASMRASCAPQAGVHPAAEADVQRLDGTPDVEAVRAGERALVAVGRLQHQEHAVPRPDRPAVAVVVLHHPADQDLDRALEPQHLLDGPVHQGRVGPQPGQLGRVPVQRDDGVAQQVGGGLVPGEQDQRAQRHQLRVVQAVAVLVRTTQQQADHVLARLPAAPLDEPGQVVLQLPDPGQRAGVPRPAP